MIDMIVGKKQDPSEVDCKCREVLYWEFFDDKLSRNVWVLLYSMVQAVDLVQYKNMMENLECGYGEHLAA
jgi:hypothetical protein